MNGLGLAWCSAGGVGVASRAGWCVTVAVAGVGVGAVTSLLGGAGGAFLAADGGEDVGALGEGGDLGIGGELGEGSLDSLLGSCDGLDQQLRGCFGCV